MTDSLKRSLRPQEVEPGMVGFLFLVNEGSRMSRNAPQSIIMWNAQFVRVRVMGDNVNMEDMEKVKRLAAALMETKQDYIVFSCGRGTPLPTTGRDMTEFMDQAGKAIAPPSGVDAPRKVN